MPLISPPSDLTATERRTYRQLASKIARAGIDVTARADLIADFVRAETRLAALREAEGAAEPARRFQAARAVTAASMEQRRLRAALWRGSRTREPEPTIDARVAELLRDEGQEAWRRFFWQGDKSLSHDELQARYGRPEWGALLYESAEEEARVNAYPPDPVRLNGGAGNSGTGRRLSEMAGSSVETDHPSGQEPEVNLPGLRELRDTVANHRWPKLPGWASLRRDGIAGLSSAISNVSDGMANGVLMGVNPIYGLYANMAGPAAGGLFSSTRLMMIATTAAASLSASQALGGLEGEARAAALAVMVILVGVFQIAFGLLGLGKLIRFVSYSVTTGFLSGVSVLLILNQLPVVTGYEAAGGNRIAQTLNLLLNLGEINVVSLALAVLTLVLAVLLPRTPLSNFGRLAAIVIPSLMVVLFGLGGVEIVRDLGEIPRGIPMPALPALSSVTLDVITGAAAVAVVILVQGAGVSQSVPNPDGAHRSTSRDFVAQGAANAAGGLLNGLPVGGSHSATALNVIYGAQSRWAVVFAGVWMGLIVMIFPGLVSYIAMPALGALLILAGATSLEPRDIRTIWKTGWPSRIAGGATFLATLFLSVQAAVGIGVVLSALLYVSRASTDVSLVELVERPDGRIEEHDPPARLPSDTVTVIDVYGHLFYAGARTLERLLPSPQGAQNPAVILRLRGLTTAGATLLEVLANYADKLAEVSGRLYLTGINEQVYDQVIRTGKLRLSGPVRVYEATSIRLQSTRQAVEDARTWLVDGGEAERTHHA